MKNLAEVRDQRLANDDDNDPDEFEYPADTYPVDGIKTKPDPSTGHKKTYSKKTKAAKSENAKAQRVKTSKNFKARWPDYIFDDIEPEYRAGQLPIRELSRIYGPSPAVIIKRMKERGVSRDLTGKVAERLREKIIRQGKRPAMREGPGGRELTEDEQIAEEAAQRAFKTVKLHQRAANHLRSYVERVTKRLPNPAELKDPKNVKTYSESARNAAFALDKLVSIERKAFGIDDREEQAKRLRIELD